MSERYSRLFALPEDLYCAGSPVVIAAGTLLKDNQNGKVIAQLKLRSISEKTIKAVKVKLNYFDTAGNPVGDSVEYSYLDLNAARDAEFGQKSPIAVPDTNSRSYQAAVTEVVFADQSVWTANDEKWESLAKPAPLPISDPELLKQYQMHYGSGAKYAAKAEKDLWHCTCGSLNHEDESCHVCGHSLAELQSVDMAKLTAEKDVRLEDTAHKVAERKAAADAQKKNTTKILAIVIPTVCAVVALVLLISNVVIPNSKYNNAVKLMDAGSYEKAIAAFEAMDGYKDSIALIDECKYRSALALMDAGNYEEAIFAFESLGGYKDSIEKAEDAYEEYKHEKLKQANVGDYVIFGAYEQDNDTSNGKEKIKWLVLDKQGSKMLVISQYALDCQPYNTEDADVTWETCTLRKWLNSDFINATFTFEEKAMIPTVTVEAHRDPDYDTNPGKDTHDQIFLLSIDEANKYLGSGRERFCEPTEYADAKGVSKTESFTYWWLRSTGYYQNYAAEVFIGNIDRYGSNVDSGRHAVRPALWIDLNLATE